MARFEKYNIFWQVLLWWGGWVFINLALNDFENFVPRRLYFSIWNLFGVIIIVFVNIRFLLPKLYFQKKHLQYVLASLVLIGLTLLVLYHDIFPWSDWFTSQSGRGVRTGRPTRWIPRLVPLIIAYLGTTLVEITRYANRKEKEAIRLDKEKLETELKFLKSQVNPHFLFNALNNIYSLSVTQAPQTPETVMQLSEILRYMVYDSNEPKVPLEKEIKYIQNFIDLKLLKDSRGMDVELDIPSAAPNLMIPPLLFIPFVENAFKHSRIEDLKEGFVKIKLSTVGNHIIFNVLNSIPAQKFTKDKQGGVGLDNIKKRLQLLYPADHFELDIKQNENQYESTLKLVVT
jgi:sensor histidine kinase YesM